MGDRILRFGRRIRDLYQVLLICRFSVLTLLTGIAFLIVASQGGEVLRALADRSIVSWLAFLVATLLWAGGGWYWSRCMLSFRYPNWPPVDDPLDPGRRAYVRGLIRWTPRIVGALSCLTVVAAIVLASVPYSSAYGDAAHAQGERQRLWALALCTAIVTVGFQLLVHFRRRWFARFFADSQDKSVPIGSWESIIHVPRATRIALAVSLAFTVVCFVGFTIRPLNLAIAPLLGAATIVLLAAAAWVPTGSALVYIGDRAGIPILSLLAVMLVVFSSWNDNHAVRALKDRPDAAVVQGSVHTYFESWRKDRNDAAPGKPTQVFIVAADGGGIRAAYWTALVLAALQDRYPAFARSVFAISGVSGGSLGGAVFAALVSEGARAKPLQCGTSGGSPGQLSRCTHAILSHDFLAPTLATMLYPDLVQRFLPVGIPYFDRGTTLEETFEHGWKDAAGTDRFAEPFAGLWTGNAAYRVPALVLNGTSVEQGRRLLTTNLPVRNEATATEFMDADDARAILGYDVRLSTAVNNSARFTYVSPGGRLRPAAYIVDGGYFENSGGTSAAEILAAAKPNPEDGTIVPIVIHISNDPEPESAETNVSNNAASEALTPIVTLLNSRTAHGVYATEALRRDVESRHGSFISFKLYQRGVPLPLGWALSSSATGEMQLQLAKYFRCDAENAQRIREWLGEPAIPCVAD